MNTKEILIRPLFTEKNTDLNAEQNQYGFIVAKAANKIEIARAIKERYNVTVTSVNTAVVKGKTKTQFTRRGRLAGKKPTYKKAFVSLKEGDTIDIVEQA
jgi:large subunit ribosomal protein L23